MQGVWVKFYDFHRHSIPTKSKSILKDQKISTRQNISKKYQLGDISLLKAATLSFQYCTGVAPELGTCVCPFVSGNIFKHLLGIGYQFSIDVETEHSVPFLTRHVPSVII